MRGKTRHSRDNDVTAPGTWAQFPRPPFGPCIKWQPEVVWERDYSTNDAKRHYVRMCNNVSSKNKFRCRDGAVCVPARYGKTTWRKNCWNKEEGRSMQRGGPVGPRNKEEGRSMQNPGH